MLLQNLEYIMADLFAEPISKEKLGELIVKIASLREQRAYHEKESEKLGTMIELVEEEILHALTDHQLEEAAYGGFKVVPRGHTYPHVEDWNKFYEFIHENKYWHLLDRRASVSGYRELLNLGREVPGVVPFVKMKLSVTKSAR
jgi:hypothetical protein